MKKLEHSEKLSAFFMRSNKLLLYWDCSHCNMTLRRNKGIKIGNEEEKLFAEDIFLITENHKNLPKYLLELIREFNNAA